LSSSQVEETALSVDIEKALGSFELRPRFAVGRELIVLFGHSGSGKSLTLAAIAGLLRPDRGQIIIDGTPVFDAARGVDVPPQQRGAGLVVQSYALFPHLSVRDNIAFGLHGRTAAERRRRVAELVDLLALHGLEDRRPHQISGGQAQRVALARALAPRPRLLLLDEPFSALDSAIRVNLRRELARLKRELDLTIVFVTHDLREAFNLADSIAVFDAGRVLQVGDRDEVFNRPVSARVAELTDVRNIWHGRVQYADAAGVVVETGRFAVVSGPAAFTAGEPADICIRPERVVLLRPERHPGEEHARDTVLTAAIVDEVAHGASHTLYFRVIEGSPPSGYDIEVDLPALPYDALGVHHQRMWTLALPRAAMHVMRAAPDMHDGARRA
jgi:molybdate transport system ATP-binding protein